MAGHVDQVVRESVGQTLNGLLEEEAKLRGGALWADRRPAGHACRELPAEAADQGG